MEKENGYIGLYEPPNFDEKSSLWQWRRVSLLLILKSFSDFFRGYGNAVEYWKALK